MSKFITILVLCFGLMACKTSMPVYNASEKPVGANFGIEGVKKSIVDALTFKRWRVLNVTDEKVEAEIYVRSHYARINVNYSTQSYSINYVDSTNLDYDGGKIHRNYNKWIMLLDQEIAANIGRVKFSTQ